MLSDHAGLPASFDDDLTREPVYTTQGTCPSCGCDQGQQGCAGRCGNPYCECSDAVADDDIEFADGEMGGGLDTWDF